MSIKINIKNGAPQPETEEELQDLIRVEIKQYGNKCDLSHIDVSLVTDFSWLFHCSNFNGIFPVGMFQVSKIWP